MSSEIYELMKRPDELAVVAKAHSQPRFVEDCVREMIRAVVEGYPDLPAEAFVMARQENLETIHRHNVVAERYGTLGDLRQELASGEHQARHTTMREWLEAPRPSPASAGCNALSPCQVDRTMHLWLRLDPYAGATFCRTRQGDRALHPSVGQGIAHEAKEGARIGLKHLVCGAAHAVAGQFQVHGRLMIALEGRWSAW